MTIAQTLERYPFLAEVFRVHGMGCCACLGAETDTIERVASIYGINLEQLIQELNLAVLLGQ
jgi:hybrid cluster-associated redox disulfide protein